MNLPVAFISQIEHFLQNETVSFLEALKENAPVSIRVNNKVELTPSNEKVPWCDAGYYLRERPLFTADPLFHAGAYYVQEASSMFLQQALEQCVSKDSCVLDLSAAPGGKSTLISQFLSEEGFLVSNEIIKSRAFILAENLIKWGNDNVVVSNNSPKDFQLLSSFFDVLVVDAPCSGEGMFRKDAGAIDEWSEQNVLMCSQRQKDILVDVWDTLKTGGILIYSTCTYNRNENENNVEWIKTKLGAESLFLNIDKFPEITAGENGYRFFPHKTRGEGFFISVLRKTGESPVLKNSKKKNTAQNTKTDYPFSFLKENLINPDSWKLYLENNLVSAIKKNHAEKLDLLKKKIRLIHFGISLAEQKGKNFIPNISLALSKKINFQKLNCAEIDRETAIQYLRKEAVHIPEAEKGYVLLTFQQVPIGWIKNIGSRSNNLYPTEWRIRMRI